MRYLVVLLTLVLAGCGDLEKVKQVEDAPPQRFTVTNYYFDRFGPVNTVIDVVHDIQDNKSFMVISNSRGLAVVQVNPTKVEK